MKVRRTKTFDKLFLKLPERIRIKTEKAIKLMNWNDDIHRCFWEFSRIDR